MDVKDVIWINCKVHLIEKPRRIASVTRMEMLAHLNDIIDVVPDLRSKNRMPRCIIDGIGMARWPHNTAIVNSLNYSEKFKQLEEKFSLLESTVNIRFEEIKIKTTEMKLPSSLI